MILPISCPIRLLVPLLSMALFFLSHCQIRPQTTISPLTTIKRDWSELSGWNETNDLHKRLAHWEASCDAIARRNATSNQFLHKDQPIFGTLAAWQQRCHAYRTQREQWNSGPDAARNWLEQQFIAQEIIIPNDQQSKFTGYYAPHIALSLTKTERFQYPIYRLPKDDALRRLTRQDIEEGKLNDQNLILAYTDDPVHLFFVHIQGSAIAYLTDGRRKQLRYAGQNGHPYQAIGSVLIKEYNVQPTQLTASFIIDWLNKNPNLAKKTMLTNPSYVYFSLEENPLPIIGGATTPLAAEYSLAIDRRYYPYGVPVWVETSLPTSFPPLAWHHLLVTQDTGGAIKGMIRGDIYFGEGNDAFQKASAMNKPGRLFILTPR
jgi:membrane-bound lytic murein transglycosylase A